MRVKAVSHSYLLRDWRSHAKHPLLVHCVSVFRQEARLDTGGQPQRLKVLEDSAMYASRSEGIHVSRDNAPPSFTVRTCTMLAGVAWW